MSRCKNRPKIKKAVLPIAQYGLVKSFGANYSVTTNMLKKEAIIPNNNVQMVAIHIGIDVLLIMRSTINKT